MSSENSAIELCGGGGENSIDGYRGWGQLVALGAEDAVRDFDDITVGGIGDVN